MMEESKEELIRNFISLSILEKDIDLLVDVYTYSQKDASKNILIKWLKLNNLSETEINLIGKIIHYKIDKICFDFKPGMAEKWNAISVLMNIQDDLFDDYDFPKYSNPDYTFILDEKKLNRAIKWAINNRYIHREKGNWLRAKGELTCFLHILQAQNIIPKPNKRKRLTKEEIDEYFSTLFKLDSTIGASFKARYGDKFIDDFKTLIIYLSNS